MKDKPYGTTVFCDDIRHEINGKMTLVGCYAAEMNFNGPAPGFLPSFAALVNIRIPKAIKFKSLALRVLKEEGKETTEILAAATEINQSDITKAVANADAESKHEQILSITVPCRWNSLEMKNSGFIKVRANLDDGPEILLGALKVNFPNQTSDAQETEKS